MVEDAKTVYFEDATEDHGVYRGPGQGFVEALSGILSDEYIGHHCLGQTLIELHGHTADCETYFICGMAWNQPGNPSSFADVRGRYIDAVECRDGEWRIASRVVVLDLTVQRPFDPEWDVAEAFVRGQRHRDDLVYRRGDLRARVPDRPTSPAVN